jgi:PAS domain S-box-containing protein
MLPALESTPTVRRSSTERKILAGFALALASLVLIGAVAFMSIVRARADTAWVTHTHEVITSLEKLVASVTDAESGQRGFLISGDESYLVPYERARQAQGSQLRQLRDLTADNPVQQQRIVRLTQLVQHRLGVLREVLDTRRTQGFEAAQALVLAGDGKRAQEQIRALTDEMTRAEDVILREREARAATSSFRARMVILGGGVFAFVVIGLALHFIRRDFAGRQRAESELQNFFGLSLDFLCIASADGYFKRVSPAVTGILGWSVEEFLSRPFLDFVHPDDVPATLREVERQVQAGERVMHFENRYRHKDGSWRVLSWRSMPQPDGLMYATARDVTETKQAEKELQDLNERLETRVWERTAELAQVNESLRNSERRFRALIEHGTDGIVLIDPNNRILYASPTVETVEGYKPEELLNHSGIENTHPDDLPLVQQVVAEIMAHPGKPVPVLWRRRHKNGEWLWLEGTAINLIQDPAVGAIVTNYRDVTQRKISESRLQAQLSRLALLSHVTRAIGERQDVESIFQVVVQTLEEHLPVDFTCICLYEAPEARLRVTTVGAASLPLASRLGMMQRSHIVIDENGLSQCVRGRLVYEPNLARVPFPFARRLSEGGLGAMVAAPLLVESQVFGVLIAARTQTNSFNSSECEFLRQLSEHVALAAHQAQLYGALQQAYDDLRTTQQAVMQQERLMALGQMASGIAHDINNAISPVALYTESLLEKEPNLSARARNYLETIQRAIDDVAQTVARMREFYRQREPQVTLVAVNVNLIVKQVIDITRARWSDMAQQRGVAIEVRTELAPALPPVNAAESEIREALINLVFNAVDAMPQGGPMTLRTRAANGQVQIEVQDAGVGMDEITRRRCLEPFFTTKGERGTGLGLAMVYGSMQRHGGEIEIDSAIGKGTTVRLCFPMAETSTLAGAEVHKAAAMPAPLRILVVDDDPMIIKSLLDTLTADGHKVTTATGGQAGIDAFLRAKKAGEPFPVVITDLGMPHVDGRKVSAAIKGAAPSTLVLMLTGWGQRLVAEGDIPDHVDRVLNKPPKLRELREALTLEVQT